MEPDVTSAALTALAMALNAGGVFFLVFWVNRAWPAIRKRNPQWVPVIALTAGPALNALAVFLSEIFGHPIDFSPVAAAFAGPGAISAHQLWKQRRKTLGARTRPPSSRSAVHFVLGAALVLGAAGQARAQTYELGAVALRGSEAVDIGDVRAFAAIGGLELPLPGATSTGLVAELGYTSGVVWSLWSQNRTEISGIIAGGDVRIARGGPIGGSRLDVAARLVAGYQVTENLSAVAYLLEDDTPFAFGVGWRF